MMNEKIILRECLERAKELEIASAKYRISVIILKSPKLFSLLLIIFSIVQLAGGDSMPNYINKSVSTIMLILSIIVFALDLTSDKTTKCERLIGTLSSKVMDFKVICYDLLNNSNDDFDKANELLKTTDSLLTKSKTSFTYYIPTSLAKRFTEAHRWILDIEEVLNQI